MAIKQRPRFCWDANCFLYWFKKDAQRHAELAAALDAAEKEDINLYTSALTLVEVIYPDSFPNAQAAEREVEQFFRRKYIRVVDLQWEVARIAREMQRLFPNRLGARDAIHLATAIHVKAEALHTYDRRNLQACNGKIPGRTLRICPPDYSHQLKLPASPANEGSTPGDA